VLPAWWRAGATSLSAWENLHGEIEEYRELDADRVLVLFRYSGSGKTSGLEIGQLGKTSANLFHVRDGKVTRLVNYFDGERALADLGLAPEASS
jgi:hypothetical protein